MAEPHHVEVQLSDLLQDLDAVSLKRLVSAPLGYKATRLAALARSENPVLGAVGPDEIVAVLLHRIAIDHPELGEAVVAYREAYVWEFRRSLGETTAETGKWLVPVAGRGQRHVHGL